MNRSLFWDWLHLVRAEHALMTFFAIIISEMVVTHASLPPSFPAHWLVLGFPAFAFFSALGPALVTAGSFVLNDYQGFASDYANKRWERPLVRGAISRQGARDASIALFLAGLALAFLVNAGAFLITLAFSIAAVLYDPVLKKKPFFGNAYIAASMAIPFFYGYFAVVFTVPGAVFSAQIILDMLKEPVTFLAMVAFLVGLGRELIITLRDVHGDKKVGATTLPMVIGAKNTVRLASFFILSAVALSFAPLLKQFYLYYFFFIAITDALLLLVVVKILSSQSLPTLKTCRNLSLAALIVGLFAFSTLAFK